MKITKRFLLTLQLCWLATERLRVGATAGMGTQESDRREYKHL